MSYEAEQQLKITETYLQTINLRLDNILNNLQAIGQQLVDTLAALNRLETHMTAMDDEIAALQADVTAEGTVIDSAVTMIEGFSAQLAAAVAAASAAGATPTQLQALTDLDTAIKAKAGELSAAVAAGTTPPPPTAA